MNRRDLDKLTSLCKKEKIWCLSKKIVDGNYSIFIKEERRTLTHNFKTFSLAQDKIEEILYLRKTGLTWEEWLEGGRKKE
jgi:hypothetical protein